MGEGFAWGFWFRLALHSARAPFVDSAPNCKIVADWPCHPALGTNIAVPVNETI